MNSSKSFTGWFHPIRSLTLIVLLCAQLVSEDLAAESMDWQVATASESSSERAAAQRIALQLALARISAYKGLLNTEAARVALSQVEEYVIDLGFRPAEQSDDLSGLPMTRSVTESGMISSIATVQFDAEQLLELASQLETELREAQEDAGEEGRLVVDRSALTWLVIRDQGRDLFITEATGKNLVLKSKEIAGRSGETLQFPDSSSSETVVSEIFTASPEQIRLASRTYNTSAIVTGLITRESARRWVGEWQKLTEENEMQTTIQAASLDEMLENGVGWATGGSEDSTAELSQSGPRNIGNQNSPAEVWVAGAGSTDAYSKVLAWMNQLDIIERVYPIDVGLDGVLFAVTPRAATLDISTQTQSVGWLSTSINNAQSPDGADLYLNYEP